MHVDSPDIMNRVLPSLVPTGAKAWGPSRAGDFGEALCRSMRVAGLVSGPDPTVANPLVSAFWQDLFLVAEAPRSQYDALRETLAACGPPTGNLACVALAGAGFHGQHGRPWSVLAGNLHLSAVLGCDLPATEFAAVMPALPAVAVAEAVHELGQGQLQPGIKWVNDVLLGGRKVAGSLTALRTTGGRITAVVVGIGLNVERTPRRSADPLALAPTSLVAELPTVAAPLEKSLLLVLNKLAETCEQLPGTGPAGLLAGYRRRSVLPGRRVAIWPEHGPTECPSVTGEVVGIGPDLSLQLRGHDEPVTGGRLTLLDAEP